MTAGGKDPVALQAVLDRIDNPWRVPHDGSLVEAPSDFTPAETVDDAKDRLEDTRRDIRPYQHALYAGKQYSVLMVFQALDAAGKDGAIREVFEELDPTGVHISSFKRPTPRELAHDFLWRTSRVLPERGNIGVFNRSYYEEVLTVRVHPEFLEGQYAGDPPNPDTLWPQRYQAIRQHELHLATANTLILKFWLNVSPEKQATRFLERLDDPKKRWKFSMSDVRESGFRGEYDEALMHMLNETSRPWAPWFCIPADDRWYLRWQIADILHQALQNLPLRYPIADYIEEDQVLETREMLKARAGLE